MIDMVQCQILVIEVGPPAENAAQFDVHLEGVAAEELSHAAQGSARVVAAHAQLQEERHQKNKANEQDKAR
eukprot:CAMPEP_0185579602 /NCGR_PEP_ID=MMETSP0434-20130131/15301_1 /TAXON_ID=626734 ORGANISM="Favella taraikaensis, Strain Fe Narragansett Bay" /NCGR_SAMPLE_ID=MMETSP0434 /ASSEMBLY_ACC=CAM_ASM_000379 /LENGTH=70 /DNA_ID=CAMNT_0028197659 /DNA_START=1108 /DNA_END=1320 /DNA_ORIENTATION=-